MSKRIICTNEDNVQVEFNYNAENAFFLVSTEGVYSVSNKVALSENTMTDGSTYQGSVTKERNIVIGATMEKNYQKNRDLLYKCFKPKSTGTFTYIENDEIRKIDYKVESIDIGETGVIRDITISLVCPDPFFTDIEDIVVTMAGWKKTFTWPHRFGDPEPFGERIAEIIKTVENDSAADNIGIEILMEASGQVKNPAIYHIEENEFIKIGTTANPLTLAAGEAVRITTGTNEKNVYLVNLAGQETEINEYLDELSEFIQLVHGKNTFKYDAESGINYLNVKISYRFRYLGV